MSSPAELAQLLEATLSPDANTRVAAELNFNQVIASQDAAVALSQLMLSQETPIHLRQSASIMLRRYVKERWSPYFQTFKGGAGSPEAKAQIRQAVFQGLSDPSRKMRLLSAQILSLIANSDWPDEYPNLLEALIGLLSAGQPDPVHGAMAVFTEFIKSDLSEDQILPVLRQLLPVLLDILGDTEHHTPLTRARTISVFRQCVAALYMVKDMHPQAIKEATASVLPVWLDAFTVLVNLDPTQDVSGANWDGLSIRIQLFKTLDTLHTSFPRALKSYYGPYLSGALRALQAYYPAYQTHYIHGDEAVPKNSEDATIELPEAASPALEFLNSVARSGRAKEWFEPSTVEALVEAVVVWSQISTESEEAWSNSADAFINEEGDSAESYSVRVAGFDLLSTLIERSPTALISTLNTTIQKVVHESNAEHEKGNLNWWRKMEAILAAVGAVSESVMDCVQDELEAGRSKPIDIEALLANVVPPLLRLTDCPFLQGRAFVFASQYAKLFPAELGSQYVDAALQVVEAPSAGIPVKISAIKAIQNFAQALDNSVLTTHATRIAKDLGPFMLNTSEDTLLLVLETVSVGIDIDNGKWLTPDLAHSLAVAILEVWSKTNKDPMFTSLLSDVLKSLASSQNAGVYETVVKQSLPPLADAIGNASDDASWVPQSALDLISAIASGAPSSGLGDGFFGALAPSLFKCLKTVEDRETLQNGIICLTAIVQKDCAQILNWTDASGQTGLSHVFAVIARLLDSKEEAGSLFIGDLIIHLLRKAGEAVLPVLTELLHALVARMTTAKSDLFLESLITPFAFLLYNQQEATLNVLEGMQVNGESGLKIFIRKWCEHPEYQGLWQGRINVLALAQLLVSNRPTLQTTPVRGDMIIKPQTERVIMTRSRTKQMPIEWTEIPFPVKALKIVVSDLRSLLGDKPDSGHPTDEFLAVDSDDDDESWTEEEKQHQGFTKEEFGMLSEMLGPRGANFDNDDPVPDEVDFAGDPVLEIDIAAHLTAFLKDCAARNINNFGAIVEQLNEDEILFVKRIVSQ